MSLSNTETFGFTKVPVGARKTWQTSTVSVDGLRATPPSSAHRGLTLRNVTLSVQFRDLSELFDREFDNSDDCSEDAIELWRENRNFWSTLENVVTKEIELFVERTRKDAREKKLKTFEAPLTVSTRFNHAPLIADNSKPPATMVSFRGDADETLHPADSASTIRPTDFNRLMQEINKQNMRAHKPKSKSKTSKSANKPKSILSYIAST